MEIKIDVYYRDKKTKSFKILHCTITEQDIENIAKEKTENNLPMWMSEDWKFENVSIDKIEM